MNYRCNIKAESQRKIINLIYKCPTSRTVLSQKIGMTLASVSQLTDELIADGLLCVQGVQTSDTGSGRPQELLDIRADWGFIACISIERDYIEVGLADLKGRILEKTESLPLISDCPAVLMDAAGRVKTLLKRYPDQAERLLGVTVTVPGPADVIKGRLCKTPGFPESWYGFPVRDFLQEQLGMPVCMEHNSRAAAQAELCFGGGSRYSHFAVFNVNSGIGSGLVLNGRVYTGANGMGSEWGHFTLIPGGRLCSCGGRGCLEQYASTAAVLYEMQRIRPELNSWEAFVDAVCRMEADCLQMLEKEAEYFSIVIYNLMRCYDLEAIFFTGQIADRGELFLSKLKEQVVPKLKDCNIPVPRFLLSSIIEEPHLTGSAAVMAYKLCQEPVALYRERQKRKRQPDGGNAYEITG